MRKKKNKKQIKKKSKIESKIECSHQKNSKENDSQYHTESQYQFRSNNKNRFIFEKVLGVGGLCEVFSAVDLLRLTYGDKNPRVAIKRLLPQYAKNIKAKQLLVREFIVARTLSHNGIIKFYDLHEIEEEPAISMEILHGELMSSLSYGLKSAIMPLAHSLFSTLYKLHTLNIFHGDIKPGNLIQESPSRLVLFDFNTVEIGTAKGLPSSDAARSLCSEFKIPSYSPLYASPERLNGLPLSALDDIFSACCTLIEIAEGIHPFNKKMSTEVSFNPQDITLPYLPKKFQSLLRRGLSMDASVRPTAKDFCYFFEKREYFHRIFYNIQKWRTSWQ